MPTPRAGSKSRAVLLGYPAGTWVLGYDLKIRLCRLHCPQTLIVIPAYPGTSVTTDREFKKLGQKSLGAFRNQKSGTI
eukprot:3771948-Rhodomonas_salina.1